ncbi:MAG: TIGR00730 family Rossman fold protein [Bacteroidaceae bacterium]|mgnify:FL=1|nr:TIGR00730 family Rossman fold protein [Bacteroidaceae bacterium]
MEISKISVYCASSSKIESSYMAEARKVGRLLAQAGITLVNGAGNMGLMQASTDGCIEAGGKAIGIIPTFMVKEGWCHQGMTEIIETADMHVRQQKMSEMGDAAIVLPGGCGTLAELFELVTWKQLGLYLKPIVILNTNGYYDALLAQMERSADECFMRKEHLQIWRVAQTAEEAVQLATSTPLWDTNVRRFAAV